MTCDCGAFKTTKECNNTYPALKEWYGTKTHCIGYIFLLNCRTSRENSSFYNQEQEQCWRTKYPMYFKEGVKQP